MSANVKGLNSIEWVGVSTGHTLLRYGSRYYAAPSEAGSWDITSKALRHNPQILWGDTLASLERQIDGIFRDSGAMIATRKQAELMDAEHSGFDLYRYQSRYFAIPSGQSFDIECFRSGSYHGAVFGHTLRDVEKEINYLKGDDRKQVLFMLCVPGSDCAAFLRRLDRCDIVVLAPPGETNLPQNAEVIPYSSSGSGADVFDVDRVSATLLRDLRERQFDFVAIPYESRDWWVGTALERFAAAISDRILIMFANGHDRCYRGEDVRRIQYNKAYLNGMFRHVPHLKRKQVLEIGASDGLACDLLLTEEPTRIVGVDIVDIVGCGYPRPTISYQKVDGCDLPFENNTFDLTFSIATLEHVREPFNAIREMIRVTAPGGFCYVQAGPLYCSPFGHHMFGYFDDFPWIHLRLSPDEVVAEANRRNLDERFREERGESAEEYVGSMIDLRHVNGKTFVQYGLHQLATDREVEIVSLRRSYEGEDLLTDGIMRQVYPLSREDLVSHGFELILRKTSSRAN